MIEAARRCGDGEPRLSSSTPPARRFLFREATQLKSRFQLGTVIGHVTLTQRISRCAWEGLCACGNITKVYPYTDEHLETPKNCGCLHPHFGGERKGKLHPLYCLWWGMIRRCYNIKDKAYSRYGARGVTVCESWRKSFLVFVRDMGDKPSRIHQIDRINGSRGYMPNNCRWVTPTEQARNRKTNRMVTAHGKTQCVSAWAEEVGISHDIIYRRLRSGWNQVDAVFGR